MAQQGLTVFVLKSGDLSLIPGTYTIEGNKLTLTGGPDLHKCPVAHACPSYKGRHLAHAPMGTPCFCWTLRGEAAGISSSKPGWTLHLKTKAWPQESKAKENKSHRMGPGPTEMEKSIRSEHPGLSQYVK